MDAADLELRNSTYATFVELGRAPEAGEIASLLGRSTPAVLEGWARLHAEHALVLQPGGQALRMANPFSAVPTRYRVEAGGRSWYGNCAWDAIGICAALHSDGTIDFACPDCDEPIQLGIAGQRPDDPTLRFHCVVPAAEWWADIGFT